MNNLFRAKPQRAPSLQRQTVTSVLPPFTPSSVGRRMSCF